MMSMTKERGEHEEVVGGDTGLSINGGNTGYGIAKTDREKRG